MRVGTVSKSVVSGSLCLLKDAGRSVLAVVLNVGRGRRGAARLDVLVDRVGPARVEARRVLAVLDERLDTTESRGDLFDALARVRRRVERDARRVDLEALWMLVRAERPRRLHWKVLAEQFESAKFESVGRNSGNVPPSELRVRFTFLWALFSDGVRFLSHKNGIFEVRTQEDVEADRKRLAEQEARLDARSWLVARGRAAMRSRSGRAGKDVAEPDLWPAPAASTQGSCAVQYWQDLLFDVGLDRPREDLHEAFGLFEDLGLARDPAWYSAFRVLTALGLWTEDEELCLRRHGLCRSFSGDVVCAAQDMVAAAGSVAGGAQRGTAVEVRPSSELDQVAIWTIDDEDTTEIDDGLGVVVTDGGWRVWIVIADPTQFVPRGGPVEREAARRGRTLYLPSGKVLMLPAVLSEQAASLIVGEPRRVLAIWVDFDPGGQVVDRGLRRAWTTVARRLTYEQVDEGLAGAVGSCLGNGATAGGHASGPIGSWMEAVRILADLSRGMMQGRDAAPGTGDRRGRTLRVRRHGSCVALHSFDVASPARRLVAAFMITANEVAGAFCLEHDLPALYLQRRRALLRKSGGTRHPKVRFTIDSSPWRDGKDGLLPAYVQVSSPLRRYADLVMLNQIVSFWDEGRIQWSESAFRSIAGPLDARVARATRCERESKQYWLLKWLESKVGQVVSARVDREEQGRIVLRLEEVGLSLSVEGRRVRQGSLVQVRIDRVVPRLGEIDGRIV